MKKLIILLLSIGILISCETDFLEVNQDPNIIAEPPIEAIFTYVEKKMGDYRGSEWYWDNHQFMEWGQYVSGDDGNANDINTLEPRGAKYSVFYTELLPHLREIRRQIESKPENEQGLYAQLGALTHVVQVYHAVRVTDIFGSIPYQEAAMGRYDGLLNPVYEDQSSLFDLWISELNAAISVLDQNQESSLDLSQADFIYGGDSEKWIKCANAVKLRIALRLESQGLDKAKSIISSVVSDGRLFEGMDDEFTYFIAPDWRGAYLGQGIMDWKGRLWASKPMVNFMKQTIDPRLRIFYEPNGYHQATLDTIATNADQDIPPVIDVVNDNAVLYTTAAGEDMLGYRFIGAPVDRNDPDAGDYAYIENPTSIGADATQISKYNQRLLVSTVKNYGDGVGWGAYVDVFISHAEVCFMMSEFILKGYATGDAEDWYNKGVRASIETYNMVAVEGELNMKISQQAYPYLPVSEDEIAAYLQTPEVMFDGANDLEKVYVQQHINFYRVPDEGWMQSLRTGYPTFGSSILARGYVDSPDLKFPRRMPTPDPGDLNRENWRASNQAQGLSDLDETPATLNSQRLWWDLNNPAVGEGN